MNSDKIINFKEIELLHCPFCKSKPFIRWSLDDDSDKVICHCPGCGINMKETRQVDESDNELFKRLANKWNLRDELLGIDVNEMIESNNENIAEVTKLIAEKKEILGSLIGYAEIERVFIEYEDYHQVIMNELDWLKKKFSMYKTFSRLYAAIICILLFILYKLCF